MWFYLQRLSSSPQPSSTAQKMHLSVFTLIALFALSAVRAVHSGRPSNVPSCTFTCPPRDQFGYPVGVHRNDGTTLFCIYPSVEGAKNPNDYFCKYFSVSLPLLSASLTSADQVQIYFNRPPESSKRITTHAFVPVQRSPLAPPVTVVVTRSRNLRPFQRKNLSP